MKFHGFFMNLSVTTPCCEVVQNPFTLLTASIHPSLAMFWDWYLARAVWKNTSFFSLSQYRQAGACVLNLAKRWEKASDHPHWRLLNRKFLVRKVVGLVLPSRFASVSPRSQTWFYSLPIPNLLPADFLHLTLARVIFLLSPFQAAIYVRSLLEMWADSHQTVVCKSGLQVGLGENFSSNTPIPLNRKENFAGGQDFIDLYPNKNTPALPFF